jgi:HK97 gp10 family phage protein
MDDKPLLSAIEFGIEASIQTIIPDIVRITPRDPDRLPKDPSRPVTGRLKDSIAYKKNSRFDFSVGTLNKAPSYAYWQEFGTPKMPPRSYLRKGIIDNAEKLYRNFIKAVSSML